MASETEAEPDPSPPSEVGPEPAAIKRSEDEVRTRPTDRRSLRSLTRRGRWAVLLCLGFAAVVPLLAAVNALRIGWQPTGDVAIIGIRSLDAWTSDAPLLGQSSSGEEVTGVATFHPGPIENWWAAPWVRLLGGRAGLLLSVAAINGFALAAVLWMVFRNGGPVLLALTAAFLAVLVHSLGAPSLYDPFNSELATYSIVAVVVATWAVLNRDLAVLPVLAVTFTVAAQVHVATAALTAPLLVGVVIFLAISVRRRPRLWRHHRRSFLGAGAVLALGWLPPVAQELSRGPSNLRALYLASTVAHDKIGVSLTLERLASALVPRPLFAEQTGRYGFLVIPGVGTVLGAALLVGASISLAGLVRRRTGHRDAHRLARVVAATLAVGLISNRTLPPLTTLRADVTRWLWVASLLVWLVVAWSGLLLAGADARRRVMSVIVGVAAVATVAGVGTSISADRLATQRDGSFMAATDATSDAILRAVPRGTYLLRYDGQTAYTALGPGVAFRLEADGRHVLVEPGPFDRGYGSSRRYGRQAIDGVLRVVTGTEATSAEPGETELSRQRIGPASAGAETATVFWRR